MTQLAHSSREVVFVNRVYWPDTAATAQLLTDLATHLAANGWRVTVITSTTSRAAAKSEVHDGVKIVRVATRRIQSHGVTAKAWAFATFYLGSLWAMARTVRRGSTLVVMTDPPLLAVPASAVARLRGARVIHWIHDIYPEIAVAVSGHRTLNILRPFRNSAWRRADVCVTLGTEMADVVESASVSHERIRIIPNWPPIGLETPSTADRGSALRQHFGFTRSFVVMYSGNLGRVHDLDGITAAAELLRPRRDIQFAFVGGGPQRAQLESQVATRRLEHVRFLPVQPRELLADSLAMADIHLITLRHGCERYVFPSKLYGIVAVGRPVLFVGPPDCELADSVVNHGFGVAVPSGDAVALARTIEALASDPARVARLRARATEFATTVTFNRAARAWEEALRAC